MSEPLDLEAIKKRAESATPGPWEWEPPSEDPYPMYDESLIGPVLDGEKFPVQVLSGWGYDASGTNCEPQDREFIAHARTDVPALVAEVERLRAREHNLVHDLREWVDRAHGPTGPNIAALEHIVRSSQTEGAGQ